MDACSGAAVGVDVRDHEDEAALLAAVHNGLTTTGEHPLALTVDGKPSNHTQVVHDSIAPTEVLPATPGRGQAKAPIEGLFGLFQQTAPPLSVAGETPRDLARSMLTLATTLWLWARNGRPRRRLGGQSPAERYRSARPQPDEVEQARRWIAELHRRYERARRTAEGRADPVRRTLLREGLQNLRIEDPNGRLEVDLSRYATEAIFRGLATFEAKVTHGTIPADVAPERYLGGIIRKLNERLELETMADRLLDLRIRQRDLTLWQVHEDIEALHRRHSQADLPACLVERALDAQSLPAFRCYTRRAADALGALPPASRTPIARPILKHIASTFHAPRERRADLIAALTEASC